MPAEAVAVSDALGMSPKLLNILAAALLGAVLGVTALGAVADWRLARSLGVGGGLPDPPVRPPWWSLNLLVASYMLLVPGLLLCLFEFNVSLVLFGEATPVSVGYGNTLELIRRLVGKRVFAGAAFVAVYAVVVPVVKIMLLVIGHCWQRRGGERAKWARRSLHTVQVISKWASPDMFAYTLMACLTRFLDNPPGLDSEMTLGLGFTCFSIFCVGSTFSSLGLRVKGPPPQARTPGVPATAAERYALWVPFAIVLIGVLAVLFLAFVALGSWAPSMELRLDMELLYKTKPELAELREVIDRLGLQELLHADVSVVAAVAGLAGWAAGGEVNSGIALAMYCLLVLAAPALDMAALLFAACARLLGRGAASRQAIGISWALGKVCMLDVSVLGTAVVVLSLASMRSEGVTVSLGWGTLSLSCAEVCRFLARLVVRRLAPETNDVKGASAAAGDCARADAL